MRAQRGAASVEMAISMIVIVPLFLYTLFLGDLLRYHLDEQEAVLSTPWDFTVQDYAQQDSQDPGGRAAVQHNARMMFCDHESGTDSYSVDDDCKGTAHHTSLVSHVCWLNPNAEEITCDEPQASVGALPDPIYRVHQGEFQPWGGMYHCHGQELVQNYLLPETFLTKFTRHPQKLTKHRWTTATGSIHDNANAGSKHDEYGNLISDDTYFLEKQHFAILTDSGALNTTQDITPAQQGPKGNRTSLYSRMARVFEAAPNHTRFANATSSVRNGLAQMVNASRIDDASIPRLAIKPVGTSSRGGGDPERDLPEESGPSRYATLPWDDGEADAHHQTYERRAERYMGCQGASCP